MNREIKFRAKVYHNPQKVYIGSGCQDGEWVYGDLHLQSANPHIHIKEHHREPIDVETIGQFTGLCDKKGTPIYEGDIVYSEFKDGSHTNGLIGWDNETASFGLMDEYSYRSKLQGYDFPKFEDTVLYNFRRHGEKFEVVGNIHDNPELMK